MTISEIVALLQRVNQVAGDIPVAVKALEDGTETVLSALDIHIPALEDQQPVVHLIHTQTPPAAPTGPQAASEAIPSA